MYAYLDSDRRLVFEAMHLKRFDACVIRVFQEHPLGFFYQRKAISDLNACKSKIIEAAECFQLHLPQKPLPISAHSVDADWPGLEQVLLPLPPPCKFEDVPE
jgi:hypothetical protein